MSSGSDNSSESQAAIKVKKDDNETENMSLKSSMLEERAETRAGGERCAACQGTGAVMCSLQNSLGGARECTSAEK